MKAGWIKTPEERAEEKYRDRLMRTGFHIYAHKRAIAFELTCRRCGETLPNKQGSLYWTEEDLMFVDSGVCPNCNRAYRIPRKETKC